MLIPIVGSGFTRNCPSYNGHVPSGEDYRQYMLEQIQEILPLSNAKKAELQGYSFPTFRQPIIALFLQPSKRII